MKQWLERHVQTFVGSLGRLWQHPFSTLLTVLVIGIALALPACLHVLVQNVRAASGGWSNALDISVYMKPAATLEQAKQAAERVRKRRDVEDVKLVEADDALEEFRRNSGFGEALDALKDNPLPHALVVRPAAEFREASQVEGLTEELRKIDHVDLVQLDTAWVSRFNAILDVVRRVVLLAAGLFALGILVIVGNTIRLDIENRRDEIEVTKLVGGSDAFVRRPFLYSGSGMGSAAP
jgi:cell division transport system permease protein